MAAIDTGHDEEGRWVETWCFTVTLKQRDTMMATFSRIANNVDLPLSSDHSTFSVAMTGDLARTR